MRKFFRFEELGTNYRREIIAGVTTFVTMAYIILVNPAILAPAVSPDIVQQVARDQGVAEVTVTVEQAEGPVTVEMARLDTYRPEVQAAVAPRFVKPALLVATIIAAVVGTLLMGLYAKRPFAIAPYMGENAFIAAVVATTTFAWRSCLAGICVGGVMFVFLTLFRLRSWLARAVPLNLKFAFVVGIGLFLTFIGLVDCGIVAHGAKFGPPVAMGQLNSSGVLLSVFCLVLMGLLMVKRVPGAILIAILASTAVGMATTALGWTRGLAPLPEGIVAAPPSPGPLFLKFDFATVFTLGFFPILLCVFLMDFLDTMGTLIGVSAKAGFLDEDGNLPEIEKPMLSDALATVVGALFGTTTTGTYIESAAGIESGGRTGFSAVVTALCFVGTLFLWPLATAIPPYAYGPALIMVGILMMESVTRLDFKDMTELIPAFATIVLMSFTYNIGIGMTAGFVLYPLMKVITGRVQEVPTGMWVLSALSLAFFAFYPY